MSNLQTSVNVERIVNTNQNHIKTFKVIVIGDSGVGKTCLTYRFCEGKFLDASELTIGVDFRERVIEIDGEPIKLQLWDTAGQERYRKSMVQHYYRNTDAVILVYDVTSLKSFQSLKQWISECDIYNLNNVPMILVGNKCDQEQAVSTNTAQIFADANYMPLFETSARLDSHCDNVESIFITLAHKLKNQKPFIRRTENIVSMSSSLPASQDTSSCYC